MRFGPAVAVASVSWPLVVGCSDVRDTAEASSEGALVTFPGARFTSATSIAYQQTASLDVPEKGISVLKFAGQANDSITVKVEDSFSFRTPRTFLAERRTDGTYAAVLGSPLTATGTIQFRLQTTQNYFVVVRDSQNDAATFDVSLTSNTLCAGTPHRFTAADLATRIAPGFDSFEIDGAFAGNAQGSTRTLVVHVGQTVVDFDSIVPGMKVDLANAKVLANDSELVAKTHLEVTDRCVAIDTGTTSFIGWLPNAWTQAPPTSTPKSPPFACESEPTLTDEAAVLNRMTAGENAVATDTATQLWTEWRCTSLTGCVQRAGVNDDSVYGWVEVDETTQDLSFRLVHKHANEIEPAVTLPVAAGEFTWGAYRGRITKKHVVLTATEPSSSTNKGVTETAEYRTGYCIPW